jgi:hypothetical protein
MLGIKKILILCQRKHSNNIKDNTQINIVNLKIQNYINIIYPNYFKQYTYITPCYSIEIDGPNCSDYKFEFNPENKDTYNFIKENLSSYDCVILNTCPIPLFNPFIFYGLSKLLRKNGHLLLLGTNVESFIDTLGTYRRHNKYDKTEFYNGPKELNITDEYIFAVSMQTESRIIIQSLFEWTYVDDIPFLILKTNPSPQYITILIKYLCQHNLNNNLFKLLPFIIQQIFKNVSKYCIQKNKGNILLAQQILKIPLL